MQSGQQNKILTLSQSSFILSSCISIAPADPYPSGAIFQVSRQPV
jgi:hypothetical protein